MLGLDGAGKTTILSHLRAQSTIVDPVPTIRFNVEVLEFENMSFTVWDIGGQEGIRHLWKHYFPDTIGLMTKSDIMRSY